MKKRTAILVGIVVVLGLLAAGSAFAHWDRHRGFDMMGGDGYGCWRDADRTAVDPETVIEFRKETLPLRDDLLAKRLELQQEYGKENPDTDQIAKIRKEMVDIEMNIDKIAQKYGFDSSDQRRHGRRGYGDGRGTCPGARY